MGVALTCFKMYSTSMRASSAAAEEASTAEAAVSRKVVGVPELTQAHLGPCKPVTRCVSPAGVVGGGWHGVENSLS